MDEIEQMIREGMALQNEQQWDAALQKYKQVLSRYPHQPDTLYFRALIHLNRFEFKLAVEFVNEAIEYIQDDPSNEFLAKCLKVKGLASQNLNDFFTARLCFKKTSQLKPDDPDCGVDYLQCLLASNELELAVDFLSHASWSELKSERVLSAKAEIHYQFWELPEFLSLMQQLLNKNPTNIDFVCQYLMAINYFSDERHTAAQEHISIGSALSGFFDQQRSQAPELCKSSPSKPLRIGFISPDLVQHSVSYFLTPLLRAFKADDQVKTYCYSTGVSSDRVTKTIESLCSGCFRVLHSTQEFNQVREDSLDILIDISCHTNSAQFEALIRSSKLAKKYVNWMGYPNTSGFNIFDYRFVDLTTDPVHEKGEPSSEQKIYLEPSFLCYEPPEEIPPVMPLPAFEQNVLTLGSFNNLNKVNEDVLSLWARVLCDCPNSQLILKGKTLGLSSVRNRLFRFFEDRGVDQSRILLLGLTKGVFEHFENYHQIDIALDAFPYGGTTTTFEALLMGCPVVTMSQNTHRSRVGHSILKNLDMEDWVAETADEYVSIVQSYSQRLQVLASIRSGLRSRLLNSRLCNASQFADTFFQACQNLFS